QLPLRLARVVRRAGEALGVAEAVQVHRDHTERLGEARHHPPPRVRRAAEPVDQHERRTRTGHLYMNELIADPQEAVLGLRAADLVERPKRRAAEAGEQEGEQREEGWAAHGGGVYLPTTRSGSPAHTSRNRSGSGVCRNERP